MRFRAPTQRARGASKSALVIGIGVLAVAAIALGVLVVVRPFPRPVARVDVRPSAAVLTSPGESRTLAARAFDASDDEVSGTTTWSSSHPDQVAVDGKGTITAIAGGSAEVTATVAGVASTPVLVVVAQPAAGVTVVSDEQVVAGPVMTDPAAPPSLANTYDVTLKGTTPAIGTRVIGNGEASVAGEVVAVSPQSDGTTTVSLRLVPLPDLLPDLRIDEVIDLSAARVEIPPEIARLYDVQRTGNTFTLTPKPDFEALASQSAASGVVPLGGTRVAALGPFFAGGASGTSGVPLAPPPYGSCEISTIPSMTTLPISLSGAPSFSIEVTPSLTLLYTPDGRLEKFLVNGTAKVKYSGGIKATVAFEGKVACEAILFQYIIPTTGPLAFFLSGVVPIKAGIELAGKVTLASAELSAEWSGEGTLSAGIACLAPAGCDLVHSSVPWKSEWKPKASGPSVANVRFEPSLELSVGAEAEVGNPFLEALRISLAKAKAGVKLGGDWAPQPIQIADASYASSYKLSFELGASLGQQVGDIANLLGFSVTPLEFKFSTDIATSPTGTTTFDQPVWPTGATGHAHVVLGEEHLTFLGLYQTDKILLLKHGPTSNEVIASVTASEGQKEFDLSFPVATPISAKDLYVFLVPAMSPADLFTLELARASADDRIAFVRGGIRTVKGDGSDERLVTTEPADTMPRWSPDHTSIVFVRQGPNPSIMVVDPNGGNPHEVANLPGSTLPVWSPDGTKIAFVALDGRDAHLKVVNADGSGLRDLGLLAENGSTQDYPSWAADSQSIAYARALRGGVGSSELHVVGLSGADRLLISQPGSLTNPMMSPDGRRIVYAGQADDGSIQLFTVASSGGEAAQVTRARAAHAYPVWSPDGTKIAYVRPNLPDVAEHLYVMDADGGNQRDLGKTEFGHPTWSPDSKNIICAFTGAGLPDIRVIPLAGGNGAAFNGTFPSWAP